MQRREGYIGATAAQYSQVKPDLWPPMNPALGAYEHGVERRSTPARNGRKSMRMAQQKIDASAGKGLRGQSQDTELSRGAGVANRSKKKSRAAQEKELQSHPRGMPYLQDVPLSQVLVHQSVSYKASNEKLKGSNTRLPKAKNRENAPLSSLPMLKKADTKQRELERLMSQIDAQDISMQSYKQQIIYNKTKLRQRILLPRGAETVSKQVAVKKSAWNI